MNKVAGKIRILHFTYTIEGGGAEKQLVNLVNGLNPRLYNNAICSIDSQGSSNLNSNIEVFNIPRIHHYDLRWQPLHSLFVDWRPDITHVWSPYVICPVVPIARLFTRTVLVSSYRITESLDNVLELVHALGLIFVHKIVSNIFEEDLYAPFKQLYQLKDGQVILNGMDVDRIQSASAIKRFELDFFLPQPRILFVGRLVPHKNPRLLIHAIQALRKDHALDCQLIICGKGPEQPALQRLAEELGLANNVHFLGYRHDVYRIMKSCDVFVLPSLLEGMPNVLFEAMIAGIPVVASDISVHRRWIRQGESGMIFNSRDATCLSESIYEVLALPQASREKMIHEAYRVASEHTIQRMVQNYEDLYMGLVPR